MKQTIKKYQELWERKIQINDNRFNRRYSETSTDWDQIEREAKEAVIIQKEIDEYPKVYLSYYIGSRSYYNEVTKIGKFYFINGRKMTKARGYYIVGEIEEITDKMSSSMLADMYYY